MWETEKLLAFYHTGFLICIGMMLLFLSLTVFLFVKCRIPLIFSIKSGRAMRKFIQKMEEKNAKTEKLWSVRNYEISGIGRGVPITKKEKEMVREERL